MLLDASGFHNECTASSRQPWCGPCTARPRTIYSWATRSWVTIFRVKTHSRSASLKSWVRAPAEFVFCTEAHQWVAPLQNRWAPAVPNQRKNPVNIQNLNLNAHLPNQMQKQQQLLHQQKKHLTKRVTRVQVARWALLLCWRLKRNLWNNLLIMNNLPKQGTEISINGSFFRNGMQLKSRRKQLNERNLQLFPN